MAKKETKNEPIAASVGNNEKLLDSITDDAKRDAAAMIDEANKKAEAIRAEADKSVAAVLLDGEQTAQKCENDILTHARTNAELEARCAALEARRALINKTLDKVKEKLDSMSEEELVTFFFDMLVREAVGGEVVCPSAKHKNAIVKATEKASAFLIKQGHKPLTLGDEVEYKSGFALIGDGYKKHCSFEAMLAEFIERELSVVAKILFA